MHRALRDPTESRSLPDELRQLLEDPKVSAPKRLRALTSKLGISLERREPGSRHGRPVIHPDSYRPKRPKYGGDGPRYLGLEIEVEVPLHLRNAAAEIVARHLGELGYLKNDPTLGEDGFEIVLHPRTYDWLMKGFPWEMLTELENLGARVISWKTGLHVHVSRAAFRSEIHARRWLEFIYGHEAEITKLARRANSRFAPFVGITRAQLKADAKGIINQDRYRAVCTSHALSYEVRVFASSLDQRRVQAALGFVDATVEYTRQPDMAVTREHTRSWAAFVAWLVHQPKYAPLQQEIASWTGTPGPFAEPNQPGTKDHLDDNGGSWGGLVASLTGEQVQQRIASGEMARLAGSGGPRDPRRFPNLARGPPVPAPGRPELDLNDLVVISPEAPLDGKLFGLSYRPRAGRPEDGKIVVPAHAAALIDLIIKVDPSFLIWWREFLHHEWTYHLSREEHTGHRHDQSNNSLLAALLGKALTRADTALAAKPFVADWDRVAWAALAAARAGEAALTDDQRQLRQELTGVVELLSVRSPDGPTPASPYRADSVRGPIAVYKLADHAWPPLTDDPRHEIDTWILADEAGWGNIPTTVVWRGPLGFGSAQRWKLHTSMGGATNRYLARDIARAAVIDYGFANLDRHGENYLGEEGQELGRMNLVLVDHSNVLPNLEYLFVDGVDIRSLFYDELLDKPLEAGVIADLRGVDLDWLAGRWRANGLDEQRIGHILDRLREIREHGRITGKTWQAQRNEIDIAQTDGLPFRLRERIYELTVLLRGYREVLRQLGHEAPADRLRRMHEHGMDAGDVLRELGRMQEEAAELPVVGPVAKVWLAIDELILAFEQLAYGRGDIGTGDGVVSSLTGAQVQQQLGLWEMARIAGPAAMIDELGSGPGQPRELSDPDGSGGGVVFGRTPAQEHQRLSAKEKARWARQARLVKDEEFPWLTWFLSEEPTGLGELVRVIDEAPLGGRLVGFAWRAADAAPEDSVMVLPMHVAALLDRLIPLYHHDKMFLIWWSEFLAREWYFHLLAGEYISVRYDRYAAMVAAELFAVAAVEGLRPADPAASTFVQALHPIADQLVEAIQAVRVATLDWSVKQEVLVALDDLDEALAAATDRLANPHPWDERSHAEASASVAVVAEERHRLRELVRVEQRDSAELAGQDVDDGLEDSRRPGTCE